MPALDIEALVKQMATVASGVLKAKWPEIQSYANTEFKKLGETVKLIAEEKAKGQISEEEALLLLDMQKSAMRSVLVTSEGIGILAAEEAINAALGAVRDVVNSAIGWTLL